MRNFEYSIKKNIENQKIPHSPNPNFTNVFSHSYLYKIIKFKTEFSIKDYLIQKDFLILNKILESFIITLFIS